MDGINLNTDTLAVDANNSIQIITGMSGAGKSQAVNALEDMGYFCVDNLPPSLFSKFIEGMRLANDALPKMAIVVDVRAGAEMIAQIESTLESLKEEGVESQVIFLEASDKVLLARFKENRRPHPLDKDCSSLLQCIQKERELMGSLRGIADVVIDTSEFSNQQLAKHIKELFIDADSSGISVSITSFGYKYGLPMDADLVIDVRFLPNPHYIKELKPLTGLEEPVANYVLQNDITKEFLSIYLRLLKYLLPHYQEEGKKNISIAIGCTGGHHRSVALAEFIGNNLKVCGYTSSVSHRDIERG